VWFVVKPDNKRSRNIIRVALSLLSLTFCVAMCVSLLSCSPDGGRKLRVLTTRPELALLAEGYEASHSGVQIDVKVTDNMDLVLRQNNMNADLLVGENLQSPWILPRFFPIDHLLENQTIDTSDYLSAMFSLGVYQGKLRVLVLGYDLPALFTKNVTRGRDFSEQVQINLMQLRDSAQQGNAWGKQKNLVRLGFSPGRDPEFLELVCSYYGADFRAQDSGGPSWNNDGLTQGLSFLRDWTTRAAGSAEAERAFLDKYDYLPLTALLNSSRSTWVYGAVSKTITRPDFGSDGVHLFWPVRSDYLQVLPRLLCAAIPEGALQTDLAMDFMMYVSSTDVQIQAIKDLVASDRAGFGFLGYFSTNRIVTERYIPQAWPILQQAVPPEEMLHFPVSVSFEWEAYCKDVLDPYIQSQLMAVQTDPSILLRSTQQWLLQKGIRP